MKTILALALTAGLMLGTASTAVAREGCGPGGHRGPYGHCRPNRGATRVIVTPHGDFVVGNYYRGRGYWDGRRWYQHRRRWHNDWRYW